MFALPTAGVLTLSLLAFATTPLRGQPSVRPGDAVPLDSTTALTPINARVVWVDYRGRRALHLAPREGHEHDTDQHMLAVLDQTDFHNGVIEVDVAGQRRAGYSTRSDTLGYKGMIGVTFRLRGDSGERIYVRPHNARLTDQLYRNYATQYESTPEYPFDRLRHESPGVYESYVDLEPGMWTRLTIEVSGTDARLYVNGAAQPCLIVHDLKLGDTRGRIALWSRISTDAYFSNLRVARKP